MSRRAILRAAALGVVMASGSACIGILPNFQVDGGECESSADCPVSESECVASGCIDHVCVVADAPASTACGPGCNLDGVCNGYYGVCDGNGSCVECNEPTDCWLLEGECISSVTCVEHLCGSIDEPTGTGCSAGKCDGSGACLQCLLDSDCPGGYICQMGACYIL